MGMVVSVGPEVKTVKAGDLVELGRWDNLYFFNPSRWLTNWNGEGGILYRDGYSGFEYTAHGRDSIFAGFEDRILYRISRTTEGEPLGMYAVGDRVLIKCGERPEIGTGIISGGLRPDFAYGQVQSVGGLSSGDIRPGQWIFTDRRRGSQIRIGQERYRVVPERYCLGTFEDGEQPEWVEVLTRRDHKDDWRVN